MTELLDPTRLRGRLKEAPATMEGEVVWCEGNANLLSMCCASVVGTRDPSEDGIRRTQRLSALLVREGFCVVSGLARGVDRVAHETVLRLNGGTIAVMGTPIDSCYPREHYDLKRQIAERGLVLSQFAPGTPVHRSNFPKRNVFMARLSDTTFVVEAAVDSGTRHQVRAAIRMGKPVAFLASLVNLDYPWVREALETGLGVVIHNTQDAVALLSTLKQRTRTEQWIPTATTQNTIASRMEPFVQRVDSSSPFQVRPTQTDIDMPNETREIDRSVACSADVVQAPLPLEIGDEVLKPSLFERVWKFFLAG